MSQQGEAAEQIVNMATNVTVKGVECATNLAGKGALSLATFLIAVLKDQKRTKGKARMKAFNGKPTKVFVIKNKDMKIFAEEAKKYGVLYAAVVNKKQPDGLVDVVVNANDAARVNRIADRFALSTVDVEKIRADIEKSREAKTKKSVEKERTTPPAEKEAHTVDDKTLDDILGKPAPQKTEHKPPADITEKVANPTKARTEKSNPSAPFSNNKERFDAESFEPERTRPSVRQQIQEIKAERQTEKQKQPARDKTRQTTHKQPQKNKYREKGSKCNGELRQSVFKSAAVQRATL